MELYALLFLLAARWTSTLAEHGRNIHNDLKIVEGFTSDLLNETTDKPRVFVKENGLLQCYPPCNSYHGVCIEDPNEPGGKRCKCDEGWKGKTCNDRICDPDCVNGHGECVLDSSGKKKCQCYEKWTGNTCEKCSVNWDNYPKCETPKCTQGCVHGQCIIGAGNKPPHTCKCEVKWEGNDCNTRTCPETYFLSRHVCSDCSTADKALKFTKEARKGDENCVENHVFYDNQNSKITYMPSTYYDTDNKETVETCVINAPGATTFYCKRDSTTVTWDTGYCKPVGTSCAGHHRWKQAYDPSKPKDVPGHFYFKSLKPSTCQVKP